MPQGLISQPGTVRLVVSPGIPVMGRLIRWCSGRNV